MQTGNMSTFGVVKVEPSYPIWAIDTVAGIATMTVCGVVLMLISIAVSIICCYRYRVCCFSRCKRSRYQAFKNVLLHTFLSPWSIRSPCVDVTVAVYLKKESFRAVPEIILGGSGIFFRPLHPQDTHGVRAPRPPGHVSALINPAPL